VGATVSPQSPLKPKPVAGPKSEMPTLTMPNPTLDDLLSNRDRKYPKLGGNSPGSYPSGLELPSLPGESEKPTFTKQLDDQKLHPNPGYRCSCSFCPCGCKSGCPHHCPWCHWSFGRLGMERFWICVLVGYGWLGAWIIDKITITAGQIGFFHWTLSCLDMKHGICVL